MLEISSTTSVVFVATMVVAIGWVVRIVRSTGEVKASINFSRLVVAGLIVQAVLVLASFYEKTHTTPPRFVLVVLPSFLFIAWLFARRSALLKKLSLRSITLMNVIRIPIEVVLLWLAHEKAIPYLMTFEGQNFDILMGITAPLAAWFFLPKLGEVKRWPLLIWNVVGLAFLLNIVLNAILSLPSVIQVQAFDQPNLAVMHLPFIYLPAVLVPIVFFGHLLSILRLTVWSDTNE